MGVVTSVINAAEEKLDAKIDPDFKEYVAKFYTEALSGMLIDWVKERNKHDCEKVIHYLTTIIEIALKSMAIHVK